MGLPLACARAACILVALVVALTGFGLADDHHDDHHDRHHQADVKGTVTANDGSPIAGALITLTAQGFSKETHSNARGRFKIDDLDGGTYTLHAAAPGYQTIQQRPITVGQSDVHLTLVMSPATNNSLTVIGQVRSAAGETVSTASAPSVTLNAQSAAASGVTAVSSMVWPQLSVTPVLPLGGGSNATELFAVRGPDPTETLVDIDGHQVNNGNTGGFDLSLVDPAALQDVQVIYGIAPSALLGPNTIGGGINIVTLQPTAAPHWLLRAFGGSYGTFGETIQTTGSQDRFGYALSLHGTQSSGSVNQTVLAPPNGVAPPSNDETLQSVGSGSVGDSTLAKVRYQLGGSDGYGYVQLDFRNQTVLKDESALLTTYTPPGYTGGGGDDGVQRDALQPLDAAAGGGYQSFAGTWLGSHQSNYGFDAQVPLGGQQVQGAPATLLQFSHLTSLASQSVSGPGADTLQYLYNQRDLLGDDWLELDRHFNTGLLSFKYDLETENLTTNYVQGQVVAQAQPIGGPFGPDAFAVPAVMPFAKTPPIQTLPLAQTQRSAVLRYNGDPTSHIHYSIAAYQSDFSTWGTHFDPRAAFVWTPTANTAVRASVGTTFQTPQLSELVVPPPADRVPVGGIVYVGNPNLQPDHATDYDLGFEQIVGRAKRPLHLSLDFYQNNIRAQSSQLNVIPIPNCQTKRNPVPCPISMPVNAGDAVYRGANVQADQLVGADLHVRAGWDVDSSFLTTVPPSIQDGTLATGVQSLGQPLHKAYLAIDNDAPLGLNYGAELDYEGWYNELNRSPYATLQAHVAYTRDGWQYGLYGTNLTNVYAGPFTIVGGGIVYGGIPGAPVIPTNAYVLPGAAVNFVVTRTI